MNRAAAPDTRVGAPDREADCYAFLMPDLPAPARSNGDPLRRSACLAELALRAEAFAPHDGVHTTPIPKLRLIRACAESPLTHVMYEPALCLLAQGRKQLLVGDGRVEYDTAHHVVAAHHIPVAGQIVEASPQRPYLCVWIDLDPAVLASLLLDGGTAAPAAQPRTTVPRGIYAAHTSEQLLDAVLRLCRLLDTPQHIAQLAPLVQREIMYWLLAADDGWKLAQLVTPGTQSQRIGLAIDWLRRHYRQPLDMDDVARAGHMSRSSLDAHFKAVTRMSPLQYQKQLRLLEARRMLLSEAVSAEQAAHSVGYQSASQFNREYARAFGKSPARDARELRAG